MPATPPLRSLRAPQRWDRLRWTSTKLGRASIAAKAAYRSTPLAGASSSRISEGVFVTTSEYTDDARQFAAQNNIHLIDGPDLLAKILATPEADQRALLQLATEGDFTTPTCPSCGLKMVERTATKSGDSFWGCRSFPRCRTTLQIGAARV